MSALNAPAPTVICFAEAAYPAANGLRTTSQPWADDRFSSAFAVDRGWVWSKDSGMNPAKQESVDFQCLYCKSALSFPEKDLGTAQECAFCSETVVLPSDTEMARKLPLPIATKRLNIRPLRTEDLPDWLEFIKDDDSYKYITYNAPDDEEAISWLENGKDFRLTNPIGRLALGIELQSAAKIIGYLSFSLNDPEDHRRGAFHMLIHPDYRRQGYGTEALLGLFDFGMNGIALHDIRVRIDSRDLAARRLVIKAGMKLEGEFIEECRIKGEWVSSAYYVIFKTSPLNLGK